MLKLHEIFFALPVIQPESEAWFAQNYADFLKAMTGPIYGYALYGRRHRKIGCVTGDTRLVTVWRPGYNTQIRN